MASIDGHLGTDGHSATHDTRVIPLVTTRPLSPRAQRNACVSRGARVLLKQRAMTFLRILRPLALIASTCLAGCGVGNDQGGDQAAPPADRMQQLGGTAADLTASHGYLYWVEQATGARSFPLRRVAESGGDIQTLATLDQVPPGMATDGTTLYWTDPVRNAVLSAPVTGLLSGQEPAVVASGLNMPADIVVASGALFVAQHMTLAQLGTPTQPPLFVRIASGKVTPVDLGGAYTGPLALASDGTTAYVTVAFLSPCAPGPGCIQGEVVSFAPGSTTPTVLTTAVVAGMFLAVDGKTLLVAVPSETSGGDYSLLSLPTTGGEPTVVAQAKNLRALAATSGSVYWSSTDGFYVAPESGGNGLQKSTYMADSVAVDQGHVFASVGWYGGNSLVDEAP